MYFNVARKLSGTITYLPFRVKGVYFVKGPWAFRTILSSLKMIFPSWLQDRIHLIEAEDLEDHFETEEIPAFLGGSNERTIDFDPNILNRLFGDLPL